MSSNKTLLEAKVLLDREDNHLVKGLLALKDSKSNLENRVEEEGWEISLRSLKRCLELMERKDKAQCRRKDKM